MSCERLHEHRRVWSKKKTLARIYGVWFERMLAELPRGVRVLEVGSGPALMAEYIRRNRPDLKLWACDVIAMPWVDFAADAERLPLRTGAVDIVLAFDLIHHLAHPAAFFKEVRRVLAEGGRLIVVEPWITPLSYPIYRFLHREGCRADFDPWTPFPGAAEKEPFEGDSGVFTKLVKSTSKERWRELGFEAPVLHPLVCTAYVLSLGFIDRSLLPSFCVTALLALDRKLTRWARFLGFRAFAVWVRRDNQAA
jgi:SAM-dependent methyltransferase